MIRVPDASAGKKGTCPQCSEKLIVPSVAQGTTATIAGPAPVPASRGTTAKAEAPHVGMPHIDVTGKRSSSQTGTGAGVVPQLDFPKVESQPEQKLPKLDFNKQASDAIPELGLPPLVDDVAPSLAQTLATKERKKKASRKMAWAGPAVCGVALLGVLAVFYWMSQPKLDGQLDGHSISGMETHPALIPGHVSGLDKAELTDVLRHLQSTPAEWDSNSSRIKL
ncbi:MAG: hypothetical protein JWM11_153, partial [Planctomycetaceae bacterium]|nr:hypothetical protein [Planctomycetaceae bacterium]